MMKNHPPGARWSKVHRTAARYCVSSRWCRDCTAIAAAHPEGASTRSSPIRSHSLSLTSLTVSREARPGHPEHGRRRVDAKDPGGCLLIQPHLGNKARSTSEVEDPAP